MHKIKVTHREAWDFSIGLGLSFMYIWCTKSNGNSIEFSLSTQIRSEVKVNVTKSYTRT